MGWQHWCAAVVSTGALVLTTTPATAVGRPDPDSVRWPSLGPSTGKPGERASREVGPAPATASMLSTTPRVALAACDDDPAWLCGSIQVPIDRADPGGRSIPVGFQVLPHRGEGAGARDAIVATAGGPGLATTSDRYFFEFVVDPLLERRDLVLIDARGTGTSAPIDCPDLQDGVTSRSDFLASVGACGQSLGDDADRYGSGDVALDVEDVRHALGYPQLSYYAPSYGAVAAQAYAARFPDRVRVVVADAGVPVADRRHSYLWALGVGPTMERSVRLACRRVRACAQARPRAAGALARLARTVRRQPVVGVARGTDGRRRRVRVNEVVLASIVFAHPLNAGEIPAAAAALADDDPRPLLRLGAETAVWPGPEGDVATFSAGDNAAAFCNDLDTVWRRSDPEPVREAKYEEALEARPSSEFAPFSKSALTHLFPPDLCVQWPAPDRFTPAVPRGTSATGFPVLQLTGDLDGNVPRQAAHKIRSVFPQVQVVDLQGSPHTPGAWSDCARAIARHFLRTLQTGDTGCARTPSFVGAAVAEAPRTASEATQASRLAGDASRPGDRRVTTAAVRTVLDAWLRSFRIPGAVGDGTGLRGGTFDFDYESSDEGAVVNLAGATYVRNVDVTGRSRLAYADSTLTMALDVDGPAAADTRLRATGTWDFGAPFRAFEVTGSVRGRTLHLRVPAG